MKKNVSYFNLFVGFLGAVDESGNLSDNCEASNDDEIPSPILGTLKSPQLSPLVPNTVGNTVPDLNEELSAVKRRKVVKKNK